VNVFALTLTAETQSTTRLRREETSYQNGSSPAEVFQVVADPSRVGTLQLIAFVCRKNYHPKIMSPEEFRRIALSMTGAIEGAHMGHPDFRANGKIFATLYPDGESGMVKLTPDQQQEFLLTDAENFVRATGAWGRQGCTTVRLDSVDEETLGHAMTLAWQYTVKNPLAKASKTRRSAKPSKPTRRR